MTVERLERVLRRLRQNNPGKQKILNIELRRAIMRECGTDPTTYLKNRKALITLGMIKSYKKSRIILTGEDLSGS